MEHEVYEIYEGSTDGLTQLINILEGVKNSINGANLDIIAHRGNIEVIDEDGNTICEINV